MAVILYSKFTITHLYHFTDVRNIPSIKKFGLLSHAELQRQSVEVAAPGGNDWSHEEDQRRGLDEYVHLCFFDQHPMEYIAKKDGHIVETTFLKVSPEILKNSELRFTGEVANKSGSKLLTLEQAVDLLDFEVIGTRTDWRDSAIQQRLKAAKKYEVLVPKAIPANMISFT
ncbi:MAG: hypothetical protein B7Z37_09815 [Verrucomicrobia bacterium 12-59-8]|nr:MAG: hypothetical protein B7Z37_09815 [Verrucomicrobia bacterium 12-59-8]